MGYDVYRLTHETLCGRKLSDFSLPRTIGYYANAQLAIVARDTDISRRAIREMEWTTPDDYAITPVTIATA